MDLGDCILKYVNSYEGEDSLGRDVSGRSEYFCPVADLCEGEEVKWDRSMLGYPDVKCRKIDEDSITLLYTNYFNPNSSLSETREVILKPGGSWGHSLGGGRYDHHYDLQLVKK